MYKMFTIDLEEKIIKEKEKELQKHNSILSQASAILSESTEDDLKYLQNCGFDIDAYKKVVDVNTREGYSNLEPSRIFSTKEIRNICLKYNLRFLNVKYYTGTVPFDLPQKLRSVEKKLNVVKLDSACLSIVAPKSSFKLEDRPKDPLLFYDLGHGMYYLVHKWGDDLSSFNRVKGFLKSDEFTNSMIIIGIIYSMMLTWGIVDPTEDIEVRVVATLMMGGVSFIVLGIFTVILDKIFPNNEIWEYNKSWNKNYK